MRSIKTWLTKPLFWIVAVVLLIRLPAIWHGLPAVYNSTEYFTAKTALSMAAAASLDPLTYIYPAAWYYLEIIVFGGLFVFGYVVGWISGSTEFAVRFLIEPTPFYAAARGVSLMLSLTSIGLMYTLIKKRHDVKIAVVTAVAFAADYYLNQYATNATADSLLVFFSTLAVYFLLKTEHAEKNYFIYAGLFAGMAIGTKYNAGFYAPALLLAAWLRSSDSRQKVINSVLVLIAIIAGFVVLNPGWLIAPGKWIDGFMLISGQMQNAVSLERGSNYLWELWQLLRHASMPVLAGMGIGLWLMIFRRGRKNWPLHVIWICTFLYVGSWQKKGIDYLLPAFPVWFVFFADGLRRLKSMSKNRLVIALIVLPSIVLMLYSAFLAMRKDTRQLASEWVIANTAGESLICYDNYHYDLTLYDVRRFTDYGAGAAHLPAAVKNELKMYMTDSRQRPMINAWIDSTTAGANSFLEQNAGRRHRTLNEMRVAGVDYLVNNSSTNAMYLSADQSEYEPEMQSQIASVKQFYHNVEKKLKPVAVFSPDWDRPGPRIEIFALKETNNR